MPFVKISFLLMAAWPLWVKFESPLDSFILAIYSGIILI